MTLGVTKAWRRHGLGSRLLGMIVDRMLNDVRSPPHASTCLRTPASRCDVITLHVKFGNEGALRLYQSHSE